jgi:hypothetical protein
MRSLSFKQNKCGHPGPGRASDWVSAFTKQNSQYSLAARSELAQQVTGDRGKRDA